MEPLKTKSASEVGDIFWKYICLFGPSKIVISDMGTEFLNKVFEHIAKKAGIELRVTSSYQPRANGQTERVNGVMLQLIRKCAADDKENWARWIPFATLAYNTKVHTTTGYTPFKLMYGRETNSFDDYRNINNKETDEEVIIRRTKEIKDLVEITHEKATKNIKKAKESQMKSQNKNNNTASEEIVPGTHVYIATVGMHNKLHDKYKGTFIVVRRARSGNYIVKNMLGIEITNSFPRERLKVVSTIEEENEPLYAYERILDDRINEKGQQEYLIQWKSGFEPNSWEPAENIIDPDFINEYRKNKISTQQNVQENSNKQENNRIKC